MIECAVEGPEIGSSIGTVIGIGNLRGGLVKPLITLGIVPGEHVASEPTSFASCPALPPMRTELAA
jgi:hypothetical protein